MAVIIGGACLTRVAYRDVAASAGSVAAVAHGPRGKGIR